ncbi:MAG TPA: hypothetical protein VGJ02_05250 [Pyrinomonadaceae bacterium]
MDSTALDETKYLAFAGIRYKRQNIRRDQVYVPTALWTKLSGNFSALL